MKDIKILNEKIDRIKDIVIFISLLSWILIPVFESFVITYKFVYEQKYTLMKIIGVIGIYALIYYIYIKLVIKENKKEILREMMPIIIFLMYMIWTLISCFNSPNKQLAFFGTEYRKDGYITYIIYAGFFLCAYLLKSKKIRGILLNVFILVSLFLLFASRIWSQHASLIEIFMVNSPEHSIFYQFNHYGYYLTLSLMCCFGLYITENNKLIKIFYLIAYTLIGYNLILNDTWGCYLAVSITLILFLIWSLIKKQYRIVTIIAITVFIILSCVVTKNEQNIVSKNLSTFMFDIKSVASKITGINFNDGEDIEKNFDRAGTGRMILWRYGFQFLLESPIIGYGPENLEEKYEKLGVNQDRPHNLLIQLATTSGIPGMMLYVTAVRNNCYKRDKTIKK